MLAFLHPNISYLLASTHTYHHTQDSPKRLLRNDYDRIPDGLDGLAVGLGARISAVGTEYPEAP